MKLVVVAADLHTNSVRGICLGRVNLDAGGSYSPSRAQRKVARAWNKTWDRIYEMKREYDCPLYTVINGDTSDKNSHDGSGLISQLDSDCVEFAAAALEKPREMSDEFFVVRGTPAHEGQQAALAELIAKDLDATPDEESDTHSWWWLPLEADGVTFDIAHHPLTTGRRPYTKPASAARHGIIIREHYLDEGLTPPMIAIRGHAHYYQPGPREPRPQFFYCPPWQLTTSFGHRLGAGGRIEPVGNLWYMCDDGEYDWDVIQTRIRRRRAWKSS